MYSHTSHGNSPSESTKQQVHADTEPNGHNNLFLNTKIKIMLHKNQNTTMKTKPISLLVLALFGFLTVCMVGCQKDDDVVIPQQELSLEDVSKVSLQRLAEMQYDQSLDESLYDDVEKKISSLDDKEYDIFLQEWAKVEVQNAIRLGVISSNEEKEVLQKTIEKLLLRNQKANELYGTSMNKLSLEEQEMVVKDLELGYIENKLVAKASCPGYYYGYPTTNNGSGLTSCSGYLSATNAVDDDCDYEFRFYPGPITYVPANLKTKGTSSSANWILNQGGVNGRIASASEFRILIGKNRILIAYPISGPSGFAADFKFR